MDDQDPNQDQDPGAVGQSPAAAPPARVLSTPAPLPGHRPRDQERILLAPPSFPDPATHYMLAFPHDAVFCDVPEFLHDVTWTLPSDHHYVRHLMQVASPCTAVWLHHAAPASWAQLPDRHAFVSGPYHCAFSTSPEGAFHHVHLRQFTGADVTVGITWAPKQNL